MRSMTGFAQGRFVYDAFTLFISCKGLNSRFLEINLKGSGVTPAVEKLVRDLIKGKLQRGKVDIVFDMFQTDAGNWDIQINEALLERILRQLAAVRRKVGRRLTLSLDPLLRLPMVFHLEHALDSLEGRMLQNVRQALETVLDEFLNQRRLEGESIRSDLQASLARIDASITALTARQQQVEQELFNTYRARIAKLLEGVPLDDKRLLQEAAILTEKGSISEEINRLATHRQRLQALLADERCATQGREADFLTQEMQRETHTISAKSNCLEIHQVVLDLRREIETVKQQVQNIE